MDNDNKIKVIELQKKANIIRRHVIKMLYDARSGHTGGCMSCTDILTVLYFDVLKKDLSNPKWEGRDRFILSKGHAAPVLYAILAELCYIDTKDLPTLRKMGSKLQGHAHGKIPGIEVSTGSLGQGLSIASGIAYAAKLDKKSYKVYVLLGDGELDEGQIWEAAMFSSHYRLDNLIAIIDRNNFQIDGPTEGVMSLEPLSSKWSSFGWDVVTIDGNDMVDILKAFNETEKNKYSKKPKVIIARTIKGKGISFMENNNEFHGKAPNKEETFAALKELDISIQGI